MDTELESTAAPIRKASDELEKARAEHQRDEEEASSKFSVVQQNVNLIRDIRRRICAFGDSRTLAKLEEIEDKINGYKNSMQEIQTEIGDLEKEIAKINKELNESKATERNILDNIRCRQLQKDIAEIRTQKEGMDILGAEKSMREFNLKWQKDNERLNEMNGEVSTRRLLK